MLRGSGWTLFSVGAGQILRFGKSLVLTRLLFPEAYGVMAIVWSVMYVLGMLSDAGLSAAAIRHPRAAEPDFLNTLWTMKIIRGVTLFAITCVIGYPVSVIYNMPDLAWLIPTAGSQMIIGGLNSTNVYSQQRSMVYGRVTMIDLSNDVVGLVVTMTWAYLHPGVGALVGGSIVCTLYYLICSHLLLPGIRNRLMIDRSAFKDLIHFGKWVLLSSTIYLVYSQGDRMILGRLFPDASTLGVYSIAIMISEIVSGVINKLNSTVLYPALSSILNMERHEIRRVFYKTRLGIDLALLIPISFLMVFGADLVRLFYDSRYQEAGWILQYFCIRLFMNATLCGGESCLFALGKPQYSVLENVGRAAWLLIGLPLSWQIWGLHGVVLVVATTEVPAMAVVWYGLTKERLLSLNKELRSLLFIALGLCLSWGAHTLLLRWL
jgi:O-antigen/teichoic acid export membrane protein